MATCHCGSGKPYAKCCEPYINGEPAPTAEALMRSRYSAYVVGAVDYLGETLHPDHRSDFDRNATAKWASESEWKQLDILATEGGEEGDEETSEDAATEDEDGATRKPAFLTLTASPT